MPYVKEKPKHARSLKITLFGPSLIDPRPIECASPWRLFPEGRRGRYKAVRCLRHRDARRCQALSGGRGRPILRVQQETDGQPHGGRQHRHLQPQGPSPGKAHPLPPLFDPGPLCACDRHLPPPPLRRPRAHCDYRGFSSVRPRNVVLPQQHPPAPARHDLPPASRRMTSGEREGGPGSALRCWSLLFSDAFADVN